jgi:hypothetical protein
MYRRSDWKVFGFGFVQVMLVAVSTWMIANHHLVGCFLASFGVSLTWTVNVRGAVFGDWWHRSVYALGAALGTVTGAWVAPHIGKIL